MMAKEDLGQFTRKVDEIKRLLGEGSATIKWALSEFQRVIEEGYQVTSDMVIDFDAPPMIPTGLKIRKSDQIRSRMRGKWTFNAEEFAVYLSRGQKKDKPIKGCDLRAKLDDKMVMGAQLLDFFLKNQGLIHNGWKGVLVFFWGTIYSDSRGRLCVRYLYWDGEAWYSSYHWLGRSFDGTPPAVLAILP